MKLTWKGEDGGPDFITVNDPTTGAPYRLHAGKPVEVPETLAAGSFLGNPMFEVGDSEADRKKAADDQKEATIKQATFDVAQAENEVDKASDDKAKAAARKRLEAAQAKLAEAKAA